MMLHAWIVVALTILIACSVDLDIEGGSQAHFPAFLNQLKNHFNGASKKYYLTAAPQCPYPDANLQRYGS